MGVTSGTKLVIDSDYQVHLCTSSGTFLPYFTGNVEVLVVAGGGGGGMDMGGGGGGGGVLTSTTYAVTAGSPITVTIGAGGAGAPSGGPPQPWGHQFTTSATSGSNTVFGSLTAVGGGYGGSSYFGYTPNYGYGANGGSGGGASGYSDGNTGRNGSGTVGQGNAGGSSIGQYYSGGGGGAGSAGSNGGTPHGGNGVLNNILGGGKNYYWAGGGGGASYSSGTGGNGGLGGGGGGSSGGLGDTNGINFARNAGSGGGGQWVNTPGGDAGKNTGGGGGGGMHYNRNNRGGNGGSGVVVIRHLKSLGISLFNGLIENKDSLIFSMDAANLNKGLSVEVLVVAGGGGGGMDMGGGGGGGGVVTQHMQVTLDFPLVVTVGAGGSGSPGTYASSPAPGSTGGNSSIGNIVAYAGGGGGSGHTTGVYGTFYAGTSGNGGGAGGDSAYSGSGKGMGTDPIPSDRPQGYSGGSAKPYAYGAGGGGGAFRPGGAGRYLSERSGNGGDGVLSSINGTSYYWGGGGGGAGWNEGPGGNGGLGGGGGGSVYFNMTIGTGDTNALNSGGNGAAATNSNGGNGGTNTGGGGGGGTHAYSVGGNGGSGIVIVRYYGSQKATGGTITSSGGYTIHTFTSSGTFTPTGTTGIRDISGYNFNLTLIGVSRSESNGGSLDFNGSTYINLDTNIQAGSTSASYEFWCKPTSIPGSGYNQLYIQESSTWIALYNPSGTAAFGIDLNNGSGWFDNNGGFNTGARTTSSLIANNIYHVFYSWDGSTVRVYLNGVLQSTTSTLQASNGRQNVTQLGPGTTHRNIGSRYSGGGNQWVGSIYSVKFYNKPFTTDEIIQNFAALRGRFGI